MLGNFGARGKQAHGRELCADFLWLLPAFNFHLQCYRLRCFRLARHDARNSAVRDNLATVSENKTAAKQRDARRKMGTQDAQLELESIPWPAIFQC